MTFRSEVAVRIRSCSCKFQSGFVLAFNAAEIFPEGGTQVFLSYSEEDGMWRGRWTNQPTQQCWGFRIAMAFFPSILGIFRKEYRGISVTVSLQVLINISNCLCFPDKIQLLPFVVNFLFNHSQFLWRLQGWSCATACGGNGWRVPLSKGKQKARIVMVYLKKQINKQKPKQKKPKQKKNQHHHKKYCISRSLPVEESEEIIDCYVFGRDAGKEKQRLMHDWLAGQHTYLLAAPGWGTGDGIQSVVEKISKSRWLQPPWQTVGTLWQNGFGLLRKEPTKTCRFLSNKQAPSCSPREPESGQGQYKNAGTETEVNKLDFLCLAKNCIFESVCANLERAALLNYFWVILCLLEY